MKEIVNPIHVDALVADIQRIVNKWKGYAARSISHAMIKERWEIGQRIVEEEQHGEKRATYGESLLKELSQRLTETMGKGYGERSLADYRQFYLQNPKWEILHPRVQNLKWSHFKILLRVEDQKAREWYIDEASEQMWSKRTLDRNVSSQYYYRLLSSKGKGKEEVIEEMKQNTSGEKFRNLTPEEFIKSPLVTEFLGLPKDPSYTERTLESALLDHLQEFLLELGKGYAFVERQ